MSAIDPTKPTAGTATTESVRSNFAAAKLEIEALDAGKQTILRAYSSHVPRQISTPSAKAIVIAGALTAASNSTAGLSAGRLYLFPFVAPDTGTLDGVFVRVSTGAAGNARVGLYSATSSGLLLPTTLLADTGDLSTAAAATIGAAVSVPVVKGALYFAAAVFSATPQVYTIASAEQSPVYPQSASTLATPLGHLYRAMTYAPLPADLSGDTWTITGTNCPMFGIRYA